MACNFLPTRTVDIKTNSDTLSEISETETGTSGWGSGWEDCREDLVDFIAKIGLREGEELYQVRFRVDRKKLEHMLVGDNEAPEPADTFFHKIMEDTNTHITWPSRLKVGARSKKDPHVRIAGRPNDVQTAKERIMTILDTRSNRVIMKMDVSYTDHSHIIGKGGHSIKRVMEETQCHVHFPDSNRSNPTEKSNQVSIAGDIEGVERARGRVRNLTPLIFSFELPIMTVSPDANTSYVVEIQKQYNVQVMFRTRPKLHATSVMVKGVEWEVQQTKQATLILMQYMCDNLANEIQVQMSMEISPQHHSVVTGKNHTNLKAIMQRTNTKIIFPDAKDPNIPSLKKSSVTISGNIHSVYNARQQLMGSLPLVLMFDLPEDLPNLQTEPEQIAKIQSQMDVVINIRHKAKQNIMGCVIKGIERCATNIYEARNRILGIKEPAIVADIPSSYFPPQLYPISGGPPSINVQPVSPLISPLFSPTWQYPNPSTSFTHQQPFTGLIQPQLMYSMMQGSMSSSGYQSSGHFSANTSSIEPNKDITLCSSISSQSAVSSPLSSPKNPSPCYQQKNSNDSALERTELSSVLSEMNMSGNYHGPTVNKRQETSYPSYPLFDYEQRRLAGYRAMQTHPSGYRVPTNMWSGYGISHTSPGAIQTDTNANQNTDNIWKSPPSCRGGDQVQTTSTSNVMNRSNIMDHTPTNVVKRITHSNWQDLPSLLASLGLEKYIGVFESHEVDLATFSSLTDDDLVGIGVHAFGARRKMLLAISELHKRSSPFCAAPGAERKSSSSTTSTHSSPRENW